jgi:hypothetical protein
MRSVLLGTLAALALAIPAVAANPDPAKTGWLTNYAAAKAAAKRSGTPIFLVFRCEP